MSTKVTDTVWANVYDASLPQKRPYFFIHMDKDSAEGNCSHGGVVVEIEIQLTEEHLRYLMKSKRRKIVLTPNVIRK